MTSRTEERSRAAPRIDCEYRDHLGEIGRGLGVILRTAYRSEREDWIQTMVIAGIGICFLPEHSAVVPGLRTRRVIEPEVMGGLGGDGLRPPVSPAVAAFVRAIKAYRWPA